MRVFLLVASILLTSCSPFHSQIRTLDKAYQSGQVAPETYFPVRQQLLMADAQWQQVNAQRAMMGLAAAGQSFNQSYQNQQMVNAYNNRTMMMAYPQQVNVQHSGTIFLKGY